MDVFCPKCGAKLEEDDSFCPGCGARRDEPAAEGIAPKKKSKKLPLVIALAVVACIAIVCGVAFFVHQENERIWNEEHREYSVQILFSAEVPAMDGFSPVPVRVEGTDFEGNAVSEDVLLETAQKDSLDLKRGEYSVAICGEVISSSGVLYSAPDSSFPIVVDAEGYQDGGEPVESDPMEISLSVVPDEEVTDERICHACESLSRFGASQETVARYQEKANAWHNQYLEKKKSEELKEAKQQFRSRLAAIKKAEQSDSRMTGSQSEMNQCAHDYFEKRDALLSEVCEFVSSNLSDSDASALKASQQKWKANCSTAMENAWKYPNGDTSAAPQQYHTLAPIEANEKGDELTEARIEELLGMI